jgi:predicted RNase H-like nuclease (RuvC/YqgF family)
MNKFYLNMVLVAVSVFIGYKATDLHWSNKWLTAEQLAAQNQLNAVNEAVKTHNQKVTELERLNSETEKKLQELDSNSANLSAVNSQLQQQFTDSLRRQSTCNQTTNIAELAAKATDRNVQAVVFGVVANRASEYAKIADENRIRGLNCQAQYELISSR